jgi:Tfp pilus assembly protein PilF
LKSDMKSMDKKKRVEQLKEFLAEEPGDVFTRYALALEYMTVGQTDAAEKEFLEVLKLKKDYLPVFYQLGKLYESRNDIENAIAIYQSGMEIASEQNNVKTLNELKGAVEELE